MGPRGAIAAIGLLVAAGFTASRAAAEANLSVHPEVAGSGIVVSAELRREGGAWTPIAWDDLAHTTLEPGHYEVRQRATSTAPGDAFQFPSCAGRTAIRVDARVQKSTSPGPVIVPVAPGAHEIGIQIDVSPYERRIACGQRPKLGPVEQTIVGLGTLVFDSPYSARGGGKAVVYVPPGLDLHKMGNVLVGLHPWNGGIWTYAAYQELLSEARDRGVLLLMPSGLGNSLYTADAEDEVMRAIDALQSVVIMRESIESVDELHVSIWGASMGGAGATTIGFHHPDRFAAVTSFFGDSSYDLSTYVRSILVDEHGAHRVNALDVVDNARNLPVRLIHGEDDVTSPIRQSEILAAALQQRGYAVRFDRVAGIGHAGALVARYLSEIVAAAATARMDWAPERVTYRSVRPSDVGAYKVRIQRANPTGDAFIDLEHTADGLHVHHAEGVKEIDFAPNAMRISCRRLPPVFFDDPRATIPVVGLGYTCL